MKIAFGKFLAGTAIPPAIAMALSAILNPGDFLGCVTNLEIYIFAGAAAVIWLSWSVLFPTGVSSGK
jgi:hypothetical protein